MHFGILGYKPEKNRVQVMSNYIIQRNGYYYYFRRVPKDIAAYDSRKHIKVSLKTKDINTARKRAVMQNEAVEKFWRELVTSPGVPETHNDLYKQAIHTARVHGFAYRDISEIAENSSTAELVDRMLALREAKAHRPENKIIRNALTGTANRPKVKLSQLWDIYRPKSADRLIGKTDNQVRKWENPRRRALENFTAAVGNKDIVDINRKDILTFHDWWLTRITEENLKSGSANKNFRHIKDILDRVYTALDIEPATDIETLFAKIKFKGGDDSRRSYEAEYVQRVFLNSNALDGLNDEARALIYIMADTGARVSEITGLMPEDIRLDTPIPYIHIQSNARGGLKTGHSDRQIPLVGAALHGAKMFPKGLSRYATADSVSTAINKYFRQHDLSPSDGQSLYSLRHTFKDRLRDIQAPEEIIDNLMGHKSRGPKYGRGHILETKLEWLEKIAFNF
jgi:integrase